MVKLFAQSQINCYGVRLLPPIDSVGSLRLTEPDYIAAPVFSAYQEGSGNQFSEQVFRVLSEKFRNPFDLNDLRRTIVVHTVELLKEKDLTKPFENESAFALFKQCLGQSIHQAIPQCEDVELGREAHPQPGSDGVLSLDKVTEFLGEIPNAFGGNEAEVDGALVETFVELAIEGEFWKRNIPSLLSASVAAQSHATRKAEIVTLMIQFFIAIVNIACVDQRKIERHIDFGEIINTNRAILTALLGLLENLPAYLRGKCSIENDLVALIHENSAFFQLSENLSEHEIDNVKEAFTDSFTLLRVLGVPMMMNVWY